MISPADFFSELLSEFKKIIDKIIDNSLDPDLAVSILKMANIREDWRQENFVVEYQYNGFYFVFARNKPWLNRIYIKERILRLSNEGSKRRFVRELKKLCISQIPVKCDPNRLILVRVWRICSSSEFTSKISGNLDLHYILKPAVDFDNEGNPIPCRPIAAEE